MKYVIFLTMLFLSGCVMGGSAKNEGTLTQQVKENTAANLQQADSFKGPAPDNWTFAPTYNLKAEKGATVTFPPAPTPPPQDNKQLIEMQRKLDRALEQLTKARSEAEWSITEVDGFYYLLIGIAIMMIGFTAFLVLNFTKSGRAIDTGIAFVGEKMQKLNIGSESWNTCDEIMKELQFHAPIIKSWNPFK